VSTTRKEACAPDISLSIDALDSDTSALAMNLVEEQKRKVGVVYAYCVTCLAPVSARSARKATREGRPVYCRKHAQTKPPLSKDERVYLCSECRTPLQGERLKWARAAAKTGGVRTCGTESCVATARGRLPPLPCDVCGDPTSRVTTKAAHHLGRRPLCDAHKKKQRAPESLKTEPIVPCSVCGTPTSAATSRHARLGGYRPRCEAHKIRRSRKEHG